MTTAAAALPEPSHDASADPAAYEHFYTSIQDAYAENALHRVTEFFYRHRDNPQQLTELCRAIRALHYPGHPDALSIAAEVRKQWYEQAVGMALGGASGLLEELVCVLLRYLEDPGVCEQAAGALRTIAVSPKGVEDPPKKICEALLNVVVRYMEDVRTCQEAVGAIRNMSHQEKFRTICSSTKKLVPTIVMLLERQREDPITCEMAADAVSSLTMHLDIGAEFAAHPSACEVLGNLLVKHNGTERSAAALAWAIRNVARCSASGARFVVMREVLDTLMQMTKGECELSRDCAYGAITSLCLQSAMQVQCLDGPDFIPMAVQHMAISREACWCLAVLCCMKAEAPRACLELKTEFLCNLMYALSSQTKCLQTQVAWYAIRQHVGEIDEGFKRALQLLPALGRAVTNTPANDHIRPEWAS